jgi:hypothetical protein
MLSINYIPRLDETNNIIPSTMYITYANNNDKIYPVALACLSDGTVQWA